MRLLEISKLTIVSILCLILTSCCCLNAKKNVSSHKITSGDDLVDIQSKGTIRFGVKRHAPPFSQKNNEGDLEGFDIDIAKSIAISLGLDLELVPLDSKDRIPYLKDHTVDAVIATMTATRNREKDVDFTFSYYEDGQGLICKKDSPIMSYKDLKNKKVGAAAGTTSYNNMGQVQPECSMVAFKNYNEGLAALLEGKIDAFTGDYLVLKGLKHSHKQSDGLEVRGDRFTVEPYGIAVRQNQSNFRDRLEKVLAEIWENGTWESIHQKWLGENTAYRSNDDFKMQDI
jgi:polar amino acid transport system substrate-binding protein